VAVIPARGAPADEVLEIATVHYVSRVFVQLGDARIYALNDGRCIGDPLGGYIVPASEAHYEAMQKRRKFDGHYDAIAHREHDSPLHSSRLSGQSVPVKNRAAE